MKKKRIRGYLKEKISGRKFGRVMRLIFLLTVGICFQLSATTMAQTVKIKGKVLTLKAVFEQVEVQTGKFTLFSNNELDMRQTVKLQPRSYTLEELYGLILKNTNLKFEIEKKCIVIRPERIVVKDEKKSITIKGWVRDEKKIPIPGVNVTVKGLTVGTATRKNGMYILTLPKMENIVLIFSFIGMESREVKYVGQDSINVILKEAKESIDEVVVTGYQILKEKGLAGSYSKVKAEDLSYTGIETLEQMLQGWLPGVMVMNSSGLTGTRQKVRVRGTSTILGNADPVWVVDGIIQEDNVPFEMKEFSTIGAENIDMMKEFIGGAVSWLNPNDIEDITVLKDASATAIYGVKAANGVIVITTKKGQQGRLSLSYSGNFSTSVRMDYRKMELMNSRERVELSREAYLRGARVQDESVGYTGLVLAYQRGEIDGDEFTRRAKELETVNTDWFDILYQTPFSQNHTISFSGGGETSTYRFSVGYTDQQNTAKGNGLTSYSANLNVTSVFWKQLTISASLSGSYTKTKAFADGVDPFGYAQKTSRVISCYEPNGELFYYKQDGYNYNILNELANSGNENIKQDLNLNVNARWVMTDFLTLALTLGGGTSISSAQMWFTERSRYIAVCRGYEFGEYSVLDEQFKKSLLPFGGRLSESESRNFNYTARAQLEYVKVMGVHAVNIMGGVEIRSNQYNGFSQTNWGYQPDRGKYFADVPIETPSGVINDRYARTKPSIIDQISNYFSYYFAGGYMYDNRYSINMSVRADASNRFGQDTKNRFQPVWSAGVRWNVTDEHWLKNQNLLSELALTASFGYQGNVVEGVSPDLIARMEPVNKTTGEYTMKISKRPTPDLKWEKTVTTNFGVQFSFFKNRINGVFNAYFKKTTDLITEREVPLENGVNKMYINSGNMTNKGWDISLNVMPIRTKNFMWRIGTSFSHNDNKIESQLGTTQLWTDAVDGKYQKAGYPVGSFWAFRFTGLDPKNGGPTFDWSNANSHIAADDVTEYMVYMGTIEPRSTIGLNMVLRWKRFSIPFNIYLSRGNKTFLKSPYRTAYSMPSEFQNASTELLKRWRQPGDEKHTNIPSIPVRENCEDLYPFNNETQKIGPYEAWAYSDIRVVNTWFVRFNNFAFSYNLPEKWISHFAQSVLLSFTASNPLQIKSKDFRGRDPEVALGSQPRPQNFSFTINVSF
ncbi:SusC/RagA family TonB-linked outer membrane protein [Gabonibacter chumensis]|uniref:SusC/RagA family TonB-linked outer membrane protein n=1 Tax=Gabonibacter chumensis TaxID=2972474 RepID=UPI002574695E|nr:SusC/RagA family TonB-linked outer membrane protein [Gabonibacter chumensis]MCR9012327.1 SusC/RagA family TonB-linked outer membrane protein [Gabonibacter chumensis]